MEAVVEEVTANTNTTGPNKDICQIVKGKRTKRQRPQSPPLIPFTITTTHSSSSGGDGDGIGGSSSDNNEFPITTTTEEDEEMAKCLILLAQGGGGDHHNYFDHRHQKEALLSNKIDQNFRIPQDHHQQQQQKYTSKRYIESSITTNGSYKAGMYVYECKTCGRSFSSFQALGGHRASHKKPKNLLADQERKIFLTSSDEEEPEILIKNNKNNNKNRRISSLTLELSSRGIYHNLSDILKTSPKIHECSYCGAEFNSGQALGGHMRRHRGATINAMVALSLSTISPVSIDLDNNNNIDEPEAKRARYSLSLDLNLPAPVENEEKSKQAENQPEAAAALVLSGGGRRLVECQN